MPELDLLEFLLYQLILRYCCHTSESEKKSQVLLDGELVPKYIELRADSSYLADLVHLGSEIITENIHAPLRHIRNPCKNA